MSTRRHFLHTLGASALAGSAWLPLGRQAWAAAPANGAATPGARLVVVMLRGAADGLSIVAPWADPRYAAARPQIALPRPGADGGLIDLDGQFGLHPALRPLMPLWQAGRLGFVHASGSPDLTRSHFDAQDYMESGTPGRKSTPDGWMNRLLGGLAPPPGVAAGSPTRALSVGTALPRIWAGPQPVANIGNGAGATRAAPLDRPAVEAAFSQLYQADPGLAATWKDGREARHEVMNALATPDAAPGKASGPATGMAGGMAGPESMAMAGADGQRLQSEMLAANNGAPLPNGFPGDAARLGTLMRRDPAIQLGFMAVGGWDTHVRQGSSRGQLTERLSPLGQGLAALTTELGPVFEQTVIVVMSEFGRTVRQNGNGGTDHGHGNVMWLMGGPVAGGRVMGRWPGLEDRALHEGRDLAVTTDFRAVLAGLCERHLRTSDALLQRVFPSVPGGVLVSTRA